MSATLYFAPSSCSRVTMCALEMTGQPYNIHIIKFAVGEHKSPAYLDINPKGKVPALAIDGAVITENPVILQYVADKYPEAGLLPPAHTAMERAQQMADLCFCSSTLHPVVSRIRMPTFVAGEDVAETVYNCAVITMMELLKPIEAKLASQRWWYGTHFSIVDAYLYWIVWRIAGADFDLTTFPALENHQILSESQPSIQAMIKKEQEIEQELATQGLLFQPPPLKRR